MLVEDFKGMQDKIGLYHMTSHADEQAHTVDFLYKFRPGVAPQSFGIFVAKLAGINEKVLRIAK
jgi:DNA mismatch repair protein MSH6